MKTASFILILLSVASAPAFAAGAPPQATTLEPVRSTAPAPIGGLRAMKLLGLETNLPMRNVRMILTTVALGRPFEFVAQHKLALQFEQSLGSRRYADLVAGLPIELHSPAVLEAARGMALADSPAVARGAWVAMVP